MDHKAKKCTLGWEKCSQCNYDSHPDLFTCELCDASEGQLTSDCPGVPIPYEMRQLSYNGKIDFYMNEWKINGFVTLLEKEDKHFNPFLKAKK